MRFEQGFKFEKINQIARASGAESVKDAANWLRVPFCRGWANFFCEIVDDVAFYAGTFEKKHFRLYEMAVSKEAQRKGYGTICLERLKRLCQQRGIAKITLRTSRNETAIDFWRKHGGVIVGINGEDWEVEIPL